MGAPRTPPGWYRDPSGAPALRYHDGLRWTQFQTPFPGPPPRTKNKRRRVFQAIVVVIGVGTAIAVVIVAAQPGPPRDQPSYQEGYRDAKAHLQAGIAPQAGFCEDRYESRYMAVGVVKKDYVQGCEDAGGKA